MARPALLIAVLVTAAAAYAVLTPWRRHLLLEAARYDRQAASNQAAARRLVQQQAAVVNARAAVGRDPQDWQAYITLARALINVGNLAGAAESLRGAAAVKLHDTQTLLLLADVQQRQHDLSGAMQAYRDVLARDPGNQPARAGLALLDISFGWPIEAEELLQPAVLKTPANPYLKVVLAMAYKQQENYRAAETLLLEARKLAPDDPTIWAPLAEVYSSTKRYRDAIDASQEVLARQPGSNGALVIEGTAYNRLGEYPAAERALAQAIANTPGSIAAHSELALCFEREGRRANAIRELEAVVRMVPGQGDAERRLGALYLQDGRAAEGRRLLAESERSEAAGQKRAHMGLVLAQKPRDPDAHYHMALEYASEGNTSREVVELRRTLELNPHHAGASGLLKSVGSTQRQ